MPVLKRKSMMVLMGMIPLISIVVLSDQALAQRPRTTEINGGEVTIVRGENRDQIWIKTKNGSTIVVDVSSDGASTVTNESSDGDRTTTNTNSEGDQNTGSTNNDNNNNGN